MTGKQIINQGHCSYKMKTTTETFCKNKYSVTGLCNRQSCPLANSKYATVVEEAGVAYLCMKTAERAHKPATMWHRVPLDKNYAKALKQVDGLLKHWSKFLVHKSKQRLTKITQFFMRTRKLLKEKRPKIVTLPARQVQREARRESKAHVAAQLENSIEKELLERLKAGTYDSHHSHSLGKYDGLIEPARESKKTKAKRQHVEVEYEAEEAARWQATPEGHDARHRPEQAWRERRGVTGGAPADAEQRLGRVVRRKGAFPRDGRGVDAARKRQRRRRARGGLSAVRVT